MVERGEWRATAEGNGKHVGFHIWAGYSYSPNASWSNLAEEWLASKDNPEQLRTFINTVLGEVWQDEYESKVGASALIEKAANEDYEKGVPPEDVLVLLAGIDTQDDRLSLSVWGAGRNEEFFLLDRVKIYGSPSRPDVWQQLDEILQTPYTNVNGIKMRIEVAAIDTGGHFTDEVYNYVRERTKLGMIAIKGIGKLRNDAFLSKPNKIDYGSTGKTRRGSVMLFSVAVNKIKTQMHRRLKEAEPGKGALHFYPTITSDYFEELTAEREIRKQRNGYQFDRVWVKKSGVRNEALDEMVYAYAALHRLYQLYDRRTLWNQLEKRYKNQNSDNVHYWSDINGNTGQISFKTVIALFCEPYVHPLQLPSVKTVGEGRAIILHGGKMLDAKWKRGSNLDPFHIVDSNNNILYVPKGKVWISLVPNTKNPSFG